MPQMLLTITEAARVNLEDVSQAANLKVVKPQTFSSKSQVTVTLQSGPTLELRDRWAPFQETQMLLGTQNSQAKCQLALTTLRTACPAECRTTRLLG